MLMKLIQITVALILLSSFSIYPDEGMWTFDNIPNSQIKKNYKTTLSKEWLKKVQLSSVRFNDGGSGSFVSKDGLVITNHHVALGQLQKVSKPEKNYVKDGFYASEKSQELPCPDLELNVLVSYKNVTSQVLDSLNPDLPSELQMKEIKKRITNITATSLAETGLRSDVVTLYNGGEYWLYRYKRYTDIRLVMAPEMQAAFFGGDNDNFSYPRYVLDYAFFRVYENGEPVKSSYYFKWLSKELSENQLVFVSGHPGRTSRSKTVKELEYEKEHSIPNAIRLLNKKLSQYQLYSKKGTEQARRVQSSLFYINNSLKSLNGRLDSLGLDAVIQKRDEQERTFINSIEDTETQARYRESISKINTAIDEKIRRTSDLLHIKVPSSKLALMALELVQYAIEIKKPNHERFKEFRDSSLDSFKFYMSSEAPIYKDLEIFTFSNSLALSKKALGTSHPFIKAATAKTKTTGALANKLMKKTGLHVAKTRIRLMNNPDAILASKDPLLVWAKSVEPHTRELRNWYEEKIESVLIKEGTAIANIKFSILGKSVYPDATFSLRLSYGKLQGYSENTTKVPYKTSFYGMFERAENFSNKHPFTIPDKILSAKQTLKLGTPLNIVSTNDITGGNSGSPLFTKDLQFVGVVFDGNAYTHTWDYIYSDEKARTISVHATAITESLKSIYSATSLLEELEGSKKESSEGKENTEGKENKDGKENVDTGKESSGDK